MRILHVGNFGSRAKGAFLHSVAPKLSRGLVRAGHHVVDFADRDVARAGSPFGTRKLGGPHANRMLSRLAQDMRPDLLLLGHADTIQAATVAALRRALPALRVLQWNVDPLFEPDNLARLRGKLDVVDATLVSTAGAALAPLRRAGMRLGFFPNPVDTSIESARADLEPALPHDLFFACGHPRRPRRALCGQEWDMEAFFAALRGAVPGLRARLAGLDGQPHLAGADYQAVLGQCAAGLNASRRQDWLLYSSDRLAHMAGNGQAILMDRATGYDTLFGDGEMVFFSGFDELAARLRRLVAEPAWRMAVAGAGRARYHALFNETLVARYVVGVAFGTHRAQDYAWPTLLDG
jgi:hypothetical protein